MLAAGSHHVFVRRKGDLKGERREKVKEVLISRSPQGNNSELGLISLFRVSHNRGQGNS
jgi:hypothetical protein